MRYWIPILALVLCARSAFALTVDPPQKVKINKLDRSELVGMITSYDENGFEVMDANKKTQTVTWDELPADAVMTLHDRLVRKGTAEDWFKLGKKLLTMPGGRGPAERAFGKAVRLDPKMKDQIAAAKKEAGATQPARVTTGASVSFPHEGGSDVASTQASGSKEPVDPMKPVIGPQKVGEIDATAWGKMTPEKTAEAMTLLNQFAQEAQTKVGVKLAAYETPLFLIYTDVPEAEAQKWAATLDHIYARLAGLFGVASNENIFRGKALVFIFARQEDYLKFEIKIHATIAAGTKGMCHNYGRGDVHLAFYREMEEPDFLHALAHETTHGFLHRFRSPVDVPPWVNEGLAETVAFDTTPQQRGIAQATAAEAQADLLRRKSLGGMLESDKVVTWQFPVARTLSEFMIQQSRPGYVDFIVAMKDGMSWDEALRTKYGVTADRLVASYGLAMGVKDLKP